MKIITRFGSLCSRIPATIWALFLAPVIGIAGSEIQKSLEASSYPEISQARIKALQGTWEGYGIQSIPDGDSRLRMNDRGVSIGSASSIQVKDILKQYNNCTFKDFAETVPSIIWFPAHLTLKVERTSFFSRKSLQGTLEITPVLKTLDSHWSNIYQVTGRLEQNGDYIRLDYVNADQGKKDFGTLLLEFNSEGKLCGQFLSYGPISNSIVNGKYIFMPKPR